MILALQFKKIVGGAVKLAHTRAFFFFVLFFLSISILFGQVFPRVEFLDMVTLSDGTILKGVIVHEVQGRYIEIEVWGGSTFVVGTDHIESIETEENPDYGTTWIQVDLQHVQDEPVNVAESDWPLRDGGWTVGVNAGTASTFWYGNDWDEDTKDADVEVFWNWTAGAYCMVTGQPAFLGNGPVLLGLRSGIDLVSVETRVQDDDPFGSGDLEYTEWFSTLQIPVELLIGIAGDQVAVMFGAGMGASVLIDEISYETDFTGTDQFEESGTLDPDTPAVPIYSLSLNGYVRLGSRWVADTRLTYDGILIPWTDDREILYNGLAVTVGVGYRFR